MCLLLFSFFFLISFFLNFKISKVNYNLIDK